MLGWWGLLLLLLLFPFINTLSPYVFCLFDSLLTSPSAQVEQPSTSVLVMIPYLQHLISAMGDENTKFKRLILGNKTIDVVCCQWRWSKSVCSVQQCSHGHMQIFVTQLDGVLWCKITKIIISPWKPVGSLVKWNFASDLSGSRSSIHNMLLDVCCDHEEVDPLASGDYVKNGEVSAALLYGWHWCQNGEPLCCPWWLQACVGDLSCKPILNWCELHSTKMTIGT